MLLFLYRLYSALNLLLLNTTKLILSLFQFYTCYCWHLGKHSKKLLQLYFRQFNLFLILCLSIKFNNLDILLSHSKQYLKLFRFLHLLLMPLVWCLALLNQSLLHLVNLLRTLINPLSQFTNRWTYFCYSVINKI